MGRYFVEYGALQVRTPNGPRRVIECAGSGLEPTKISEEFARTIADALNAAEDECLTPKMKEAKELREMSLKTESARMFRDLMATDLENEARQERKKSTNEVALKADKKSDVEVSLQYVVGHLVAYIDHLDSPVPECMYHLNKLKEWLRTGKVPEERVVPS